MDKRWYFSDSGGSGGGAIQSEVVSLDVTSDMRNISYTASNISSYLVKAVDKNGNYSEEIFLSASDVRENGSTTISVEWKTSFVGVIQLILFY